MLQASVAHGVDIGHNLLFAAEVKARIGAIESTGFSNMSNQKNSETCANRKDFWSGLKVLTAHCQLH
jgi:hypothetical protein